jgi:hypothetical protein
MFHTKKLFANEDFVSTIDETTNAELLRALRIINNWK